MELGNVRHATIVSQNILSEKVGRNGDGANGEIRNGGIQNKDIKKSRCKCCERMTSELLYHQQGMFGAKQHNNKIL